MQWDVANVVPTRAKFEELGWKDIINDLEQRGPLA